MPKDGYVILFVLAFVASFVVRFFRGKG